MHLFAVIIKSDLFAEGHFFGKLIDEWITDLQEFLHTKLPHIVVDLVIAAVLSRLISLLTNRIIRLADAKDTRPGRHSQVKTFTSILRTTLIAILWSLTAIQVLEVLGVNLGPLLASAGIAGVAIGLAAQTIVKDMLNGMLIVLEDQFSVGEVVRLTGMTGTVENMTLRKTEIRDGDGTLYIVPNSQITTVANLSRDYSAATVNVSVDFSASPDKVIALLTSIAMDIRKDTAFSPFFLKDPEILGVDSVKGSEVVYPVVFKTEPNKQYGPIREFRRRVRIALEQQGMLPGDPTRTFREFTSPGSTDRDSTNPSSQKQLSSESSNTQPPAPSDSAPRQGASIDPTTIPAVTHNPFTGEGM